MGLKTILAHSWVETLKTDASHQSLGLSGLSAPKATRLQSAFLWQSPKILKKVILYNPMLWAILSLTIVLLWHFYNSILTPQWQGVQQQYKAIQVLRLNKSIASESP